MYSGLTRDSGGIQNRLGSLAFMTLYLGVMGLSSLPIWRAERLLFIRYRAGAPTKSVGTRNGWKAGVGVCGAFVMGRPPAPAGCTLSVVASGACSVPALPCHSAHAAALNTQLTAQVSWQPQHAHASMLTL